MRLTFFLICGVSNCNLKIPHYTDDPFYYLLKNNATVNLATSSQLTVIKNNICDCCL